MSDEVNKDIEQISVDEAETNTNTDITLLSPKQQRFVHLYLTGQYKLAQLASLLDVHPNTVSMWLTKPEVKHIITEFQKTEHEVVETSLKALRMKAINKMSDLIDSPIDGIAFQASKDVLDRTGHKAKQEVKKEVTVKTFEQKLNEVINNSIDVEFEVVE